MPADARKSGRGTTAACAAAAFVVVVVRRFAVVLAIDLRAARFVAVAVFAGSCRAVVRDAAVFRAAVVFFAAAVFFAAVFFPVPFVLRG